MVVAGNCKPRLQSYRLRLMRLRRLLSIMAILVLAHLACAGNAYDLSQGSLFGEQPERFDFSIESAYLLGVFGNPHSYEVNANFLTARMRWGDFTERPGIFRGYNQVYFSAEAEPIIRGIENHYFGINLGLRYNFGRSSARLRPYFSGGLGLGFIDSNPDNFGSQGQDFTFNILSAAGVSYRFSEHFNGQLGLLYEHFSNAGQTDPNPSLNLLGPQLGFTYSF
jgi:Lipid A 3-O-deacylase (PagL)